MPNNIEMTDAEIIEVLGGVTAVARMLDIKPPSVSGWLETGIPEGRLRDLAGQIEIKSGGRFTRKERWPKKFDFYWPELAKSQALQAKPAINVVAEAQAAIQHVESVAVAEIKHVAEELLKEPEPWDGVSDRRTAGQPWDFVSERRKLNAPLDRRVSPESVARAEWLSTQAAAKNQDAPGTGV